MSIEDEAIFKTHLQQQRKVMILAGMDSYSNEEQYILGTLTSLYQVVVIAENLSNLSSHLFIDCPEVVLGSLGETEVGLLYPDLVVAFGGQIVSKKIRILMHSHGEKPILTPGCFPLRLLTELTRGKDLKQENGYLKLWKTAQTLAWKRADLFLHGAGFANLTVMGRILDAIPEGSVVHLGNSGTIRYAQLFHSRRGLRYDANRGTSGIDGSLSSAVGSAMVSDALHVLILGDLSFVYDSNGLWNKHFPGNLRIIILNDGGGGIFRIIDGPSRMPFFEEYSVTHHPVSIQLLAEAFGLNYRVARDFNELQYAMEILFNNDPVAKVLEVDTGRSENSAIFTQFFKSLKEI